MSDPKENSNHETENEEKKSDDLLSRAFRFPKHTLLEQQVCQRILQATFSIDDSVIVDNTTIAVLMMENESKKQDFKGLDFNQFNKFAEINSSIKNHFSYTDHHPNLVYSIPWSFQPTLENYEYYIKDWHKVNQEFCAYHIKQNVTISRRYSHHYRTISESCNHVLSYFNPTKEDLDTHLKLNIPDYCPKCDYSIVRRDLVHEKILVVEFNAPRWSLFFETTNCLSIRGLKQIKTAFETYAKKYCLNAINILSNFVSPKTYDEMKREFFRHQPEGETH